MSSKKSIVLGLCILFSCIARAQQSLDLVLESIARNNPSLIAARQYWEAQSLQYKTGLTLPNPTVQAQYLLGSPAVAGDQVDFFAVQGFDYPTTYRKRRELADLQGQQSVASLSGQRIDVLLEAQLLGLEIIYQSKLSAFLDQRLQNLVRVRGDFQTRLDRGDGNVLDLNKATLQLLEVKQSSAEVAIELASLQTELTRLNGGEPINFVDTTYPALQPVLTFEELEQRSEAADPTRRLLEQQRLIANKQLELSRTYRLPSFEVGYHYQGILGQKFSGAHVGVSIPIWEQKNRQQYGEAEVRYAQVQLVANKTAHYYEIKELYERQQALRVSREEYRDAMSMISNTTLLDKALAFGEITTIEYFLELSFYNNASLHLLELERDYVMAVARLLQYEL